MNFKNIAIAIATIGLLYVGGQMDSNHCLTDNGKRIDNCEVVKK